MTQPEASEATGACLVRQRSTRWEHFSVRQYAFLSSSPRYRFGYFRTRCRVGQPPDDAPASSCRRVFESQLGSDGLALGSARSTRTVVVDCGDLAGDLVRSHA